MKWLAIGARNLLNEHHSVTLNLQGGGGIHAYGVPCEVIRQTFKKDSSGKFSENRPLKCSQRYSKVYSLQIYNKNILKETLVKFQGVINHTCVFEKDIRLE